MVTLNFTSPAQRDANQFQKNYRLVQSIIVLSVVVLIIIAATLFASQMVLQSKLDTIASDTLTLKEQTENEKSLNLGQTVQNFNSLLGNVSAIQSEYVAWSPVLIETAKTVANGVTLTSFTIQKTNLTFQFSGNADTRDSLLAFKNNLEQSPFYSNIESPISNLLSKENISFTLSGQVTINPQIEVGSL
ncbi:PilN domain-containing protein [Patescibacteria group bacterium]|nr:PilN domain-containing protein [Patescibacteria group bacterium]